MKCILILLVANTFVSAGAERDAFWQASTRQKNEKNDDTKKTEIAWQTLSPDDSGFSIEVPGEPMHQNRVIQPIPNKEIQLEMYLVNLHDGKVAFVVGFHDLKKQPADDAERKEILDGGVKGALINVLGKLTSHDKIDVEGNPARHFKYDGTRGKNPVKGISRIVVSGQRVYQMTVIKVANADFDDKIADRFFSSFSIKK